MDPLKQSNQSCMIINNINYAMCVLITMIKTTIANTVKKSITQPEFQKLINGLSASTAAEW